MRFHFTKLSFLRSVKLGLGIVTAFALTGPLASQTLSFDEDKSAERLERLINRLDQSHVERGDPVYRTAYSDQDLQARNKVISEMARVGLAVRIDTAGNIIGRRPGQSSFKQAIIMGSHIDSTGAKDGMTPLASIAAALEVIEVMNAQDRRTAYPVEVVVFQNRTEGQIGALGWLGKLDAEALDQQSQSGISLRNAIKRIGGQPRNLMASVRSAGSIKAFVELQIDQENGLIENKKDIGLVTTIYAEDNRYNMSPVMINMIERKILSHGYMYQRLTLNAQYSAQHMTSLAPTGLILVASPHEIVKTLEVKDSVKEKSINYKVLAKGARIMMDAVLGVDALQVG